MKNNSKKMFSWKLYLQVVLLIIAIYIYYRLGFSLYDIILIVIILLLLKLFKGKLYKRLDKILIDKLPFLSKQKQGVRKLIVVIVFILLYFILKQIIFLILKQFGIDIQQMIMNKINQSITK
jgi:hypothetical protein